MKPPKVWVFSILKNEAEIIPFWLRHYRTFASNITVWDDSSDDGSVELLEAGGVEVIEWPLAPGLNDAAMLEWSRTAYRRALSNAEWVMWVDIDEFIWSEDLAAVLSDPQYQKSGIIKPNGFNMTGDGVPKDDGASQIYHLNPMGVLAPVYSKPVVFQPHIEMNWVRGRHSLEHQKEPEIESRIKLLHYRYLGYEYTAKRNARNYMRVGENKSCAWSCDPTWKGEHSPEWAEFAKTKAFNVFKGE